MLYIRVSHTRCVKLTIQRAKDTREEEEVLRRGQKLYKTKVHTHSAERAFITRIRRGLAGLVVERTRFAADWKSCFLVLSRRGAPNDAQRKPTARHW